MRENVHMTTLDMATRERIEQLVIQLSPTENEANVITAGCPSHFLSREGRRCLVPKPDLSLSFHGHRYPKLLSYVTTRDGRRCRLCRRDASEEVKLCLTHRLPRQKGGSNHPDNLYFACRQCMGVKVGVESRAGSSRSQALSAYHVRRRELAEVDRRIRAMREELTAFSARRDQILKSVAIDMSSNVSSIEFRVARLANDAWLALDFETSATAYIAVDMRPKAEQLLAERPSALAPHILALTQSEALTSCLRLLAKEDDGEVIQFTPTEVSAPG